MSQFSSSPSSIRSSVSPPCSSPISARYLSRRKSKKSISDVIPERGFTGSTSNHNGRPRKMAHPFTDNNNDGHDKMFEGGGEEFGSINEEYYCQEEEERGPSSSHRTVYNFSDRYRFSRIVIDDCLIFDANFESGNLMSAKRIYFGDYRDDNPAFQEYDLEMNYDAQSKVGTSTQWFFFSIASSCSFPSKPVTVKFNIINFTKSDSLYNYGMKPLCYNKKEGWKRVGKDVRYYGNQFKLSKEKKNKQFYTLTFSFELSRSSTVHYFAACFPYTYFDLQKFLYNLQIDPQRQCFVKRDLLCETLAGNRCDLLTITEPSSLKDRKIVVVTGRVHPGESNASWMVQGIIDFITGETEEARELRSLYIFKIIPMMNPDGVINGNYRNSLAGIDLNRCWDHPDPTFHPTIHKTKELIKNLQSRQGVSLLCDFHGHSRKEGLFVFGCIPDFDHDKRDHKNLIFPQMFDRASDFFRLDKCNFSISSKKAATMRLAMYNFGIERAYTVEASMSGIDGKHYSIVDLLVSRNVTLISTTLTIVLVIFRRLGMIFAMLCLNFQDWIKRRISPAFLSKGQFQFLVQRMISTTISMSYLRKSRANKKTKEDSIVQKI